MAARPFEKHAAPLNSAILHKAHGVFDTENTELWEARHHVFDLALSRSKHRTVGGGLPTICREPAANLSMRCIRLGQGPLRSPSLPSQPPRAAMPSGQGQMPAHL